MIVPSGRFRILRRWLRVLGHASLVLFEAHPNAMVFAVALTLRLIAVVWLGHVAYDQGGDTGRYLSIAQDIIAGRPYGSSAGDPTRAPLYPLFLAAHLQLFGTVLTAVAMSQAIVDAATAVALTWTANAISPGRHRWFVGLLWATYPPAILNTVVIFPQTLQVFWLVASFWLIAAGIRARSTWRCGLAAACWGAACMTRSGPLLFLPFFALAPIVCWLARQGTPLWWSTRASAVMFVCGALSVTWWTARDFTSVYRLEYLVLNGHERHAISFALRPIEPLHARMSLRLRTWVEGEADVHGLVPVHPSEAGAAFTVLGAPRAATADVLDPVIRQANLADAVRNISYERQRAPLKLWGALGAPDGCVQLGCTGPPGGYWAFFRTEIRARRLRAAPLVMTEPCLALKALMYVEHYAFLLLLVPAFMVLGRRAPGLTALLALYFGYTCAGIVFASNYSDTIIAVPRYAFTLMPVVLLLVGLLLVRAITPVSERAASWSDARAVPA